jgi:hypothetical protein
MGRPHPAPAPSYAPSSSSHRRGPRLTRLWRIRRPLVPSSPPLPSSPVPVARSAVRLHLRPVTRHDPNQPPRSACAADPLPLLTHPPQAFPKPFPGAAFSPADFPPAISHERFSCTSPSRLPCPRPRRYPSPGAGPIPSPSRKPATTSVPMPIPMFEVRPGQDGCADARMGSGDEAGARETEG